MTPKFGVFLPQGRKLDLLGLADPVAEYEAMSRAAREAAGPSLQV